MARERLIYTPAEVAVRLGVHKSTVYRRIKDGSIPVVKLGAGRIYVPKAPFDAMFR